MIKSSFIASLFLHEFTGQKKRYNIKRRCMLYPKLATIYKIRVRGLPERRMQVPVCGTGRGLDNDAGFVVLVVLVVPSPWPPPGPAHNRISL